MKKKALISILLMVITLFSMIPFSGATNFAPSPIEMIDLGDGFTVEITSVKTYDAGILLTSNRTSYSKSATAKYNGVKVGTYILYGEFTYNGTSAKAIDDNWGAIVSSGYDYDGQSSHSGATVKGSCTFSGNGINKTVSLKITCDKDGNLS